MSDGIIKASLQKIRVSPRKLNLVAEKIRGLKVVEAQKFLMFCQKRISVEVLKTLNSAIANAENNFGLSTNSLYVKEAYVGKSISLKRFMARGRGRSSAIIKPFSHLSIKLEERK